MKRAMALFCILGFAGLLLLPEPAEARKFSYRTRVRPFPTGWCPPTPEDVLEFVPDKSSATIRFVADNQPGQQIDDVFVVPKSVFEDNLVDETCGDDHGGVYGAGFDPTQFSPLFLEGFDVEANGWKLQGAAWGVDNSPRNGARPGSLHLSPKGSAAVIVSGLRVGETYVVGAWWSTEDEGARMTLHVDTRGQLGCGKAGLLFEADEFGAEE